MNIKTLLLAGAMLALVMSGNTMAQDCASCQQGCASGNCGAAVAGGGFGAVGPEYMGEIGSQYFGFPGDAGMGGYVSQGCSQCGAPGGNCSCRQHFKSHWEHQKALHHRVAARNRVWPKPFDCADRQLYFSIWEPMLDAGYEKHCTLTHAHFSNGDLNSYGKSAVAGIMRNMPGHRKTIFIHRDVDQSISDIRMNAVREAISTWYGSDSNASLAFTNTYPTRSNGARVEAINRLYNEGTPAPIIPVATGTDGVASAAQN